MEPCVEVISREAPLLFNSIKTSGNPRLMCSLIKKVKTSSYSVAREKDSLLHQVLQSNKS